MYLKHCSIGLIKYSTVVEFTSFGVRAFWRLISAFFLSQSGLNCLDYV